MYYASFGVLALILQHIINFDYLKGKKAQTEFKNALREKIK